MASERDSVFRALRSILTKHAGGLVVAADTTAHYCLEGKVGPSTLQAWHGKMKRPTIPMAWVEIGQSYVSYHLMGVYGGAAEMSKELKARMQGKTCFNFKTRDEELFQELDLLTARSLASFRKAGFISS
jgi:hypothetical protein